MSNMSRGRKDLYGPRKPIMQKKVATKPRTVLDNARAAAKAGGARPIPTTKEVPLGKGNEPMFKRASKDATKKVAARDAKAARRQKVGGAIGKAGSDMAAQNASAKEKFNAEHNEAARAGRNYRDRMQQSTPGKAMDIIKRRRV